MPFHANPEQIDTFANKTMKTKYDEIDAMIRASETKTTTVKDGRSMEGAAGSAFQNVMTEYLKSARALNEALMTNAQNVGNVAKNIDSEEVQQAQEMMAAAPTLNI
ncbi:WXG100 family type VII secretion target [Nocardia asteroides]|uniref:WXG100 family type VII secretion target n=1 Tax=Nocardia asteroides TaxID=1824 RepID=UPI0034313C73